MTFGRNPSPAEQAWANLAQATAQGLNPPEWRDSVAAACHPDNGDLQFALKTALHERAIVDMFQGRLDEAQRELDEILARCDTFGRFAVDPTDFWVWRAENAVDFRTKEVEYYRQNREWADQLYVDKYVLEWHRKNGSK